MLVEQFSTLARYNRWMNQKLEVICSGMTEEERKRDRGAPFGSIHGIWNHILLADRVWLGRFQGEPYHFKTLGDDLYPDWAEFQAQRAQTDTAIDIFVSGLTLHMLQEPLTYVSAVNPQERTYPLWVVVTHFFQHQTHHRGQITTLIEQAGKDCGVTDLVMMPGTQLEL